MTLPPFIVPDHGAPPPREPPVAVVRRVGNVLEVRYCPHCGERHVHGAAGARGPTYGHRVAHCLRPFDRNPGYWLVEPRGAARAAAGN